MLKVIGLKLWVTRGNGGSSLIPSFELRFVERAEVYKRGVLAGSLTREDNGGAFRYDPRYVATDLPTIATTLPFSASRSDRTALSRPLSDLSPPWIARPEEIGFDGQTTEQVRREIL